ncbi:tetratricopeptide repeat protein [Roseivirga pacifica]|uniref:tetratricopeptide repeat protein n=1 Tax=Roseivirga pacifica TaxID=1267423 RepID=UPI00227C524F|nr:tetratricopeptide repeat protein [Roseivirga pacifica]
MNTSTSPSIADAIAMMNCGQFDQAKSKIKEILVAEPTNIEALSKLGLIYTNLGDADGAIASWQEALKIDNEHFESLSSIGYVYNQLQQPQKALPYLEKAYIHRPERAEVALQIAQIKFTIGDTKSAEALISPLLEADPIIPDAYLYLAEIKSNQGQLEEAESTLTTLIDKAPNIHQPHLYLARLYSAIGKIEEAKNTYEKALELGPHFIETHLDFGRFLVQQGEHEKGTAIIDKLYQQQRTNLMVVAEIAGLYDSLGNFEKSLEAYDQAVKLAPENKDLINRRSQIYSRFVPPWHMEMLSDIERNDAFQKAIEEVVTEQSVVLDIGTGSGLLSMMAARAGAQKVITCESSKHIAKAAKEIIAVNGYDEKIELFNRLSNQVSAGELEQKPNVIVGEIFDSGLLGEHALLSFRHALENLAQENTVVIPKAAAVIGRLISLPNQHQIHPFKNISGFDLTPFNRFRAPEAYVSMRLSNFSHEFVSEAYELLKVDFQNPWDTIPVNGSKKLKITFEITSKSPVHGVAFWFNLHLTDKIHLSSENRPDNHWGQAVATFKDSIVGNTGQKLSLNLCYNDVKIWFEEPELV